MTHDMPKSNKPQNLREYFKIGVAADFILIRDDIPIHDISPSEFSRICLEMFRKNDEALHGK